MKKLILLLLFVGIECSAMLGDSIDEYLIRVDHQRIREQAAVIASMEKRVALLKQQLEDSVKMSDALLELVQARHGIKKKNTKSTQTEEQDVYDLVREMHGA